MTDARSVGAPVAELDRTVLRGPTNHRRGEGHGRAKWPDSLVEEARQMYARGVARGVIAYKLRVPYDTVRDWIEYRTR